MTFWPGIGPVEEVAPGVYRDQVGNVHFHVGKILAHVGAEDTQGNRDHVAARLIEEARKELAP